MAIYKSIIVRDIKLALTGAANVLTVVVFFIIAASLFVFAVPDLAIIPKIADGIIWVCSVLASLLALKSIYKDDFTDGVLEQLLIQGISIEHIILAKIISHWLITGLPLLLISPLLVVMLGGSFLMIPALGLGTIILSLLTSICGALTLESARGHSVAELLILPLYIPVVIFGVNQYYPLLFALILLIFPISIFASRLAIINAVKS